MKSTKRTSHTSCCYIIYSAKCDKYYIGVSRDDLANRIRKHNNHEYVAAFTSMADDWELFYFIECDSHAQALKIERHIKRMKSRTYIENLKKYPEMTEKLKAKYCTRSSGLSR